MSELTPEERATWDALVAQAKEMHDMGCSGAIIWRELVNELAYIQWAEREGNDKRTESTA